MPYDLEYIAYSLTLTHTHVRTHTHNYNNNNINIIISFAPGASVRTHWQDMKMVEGIYWQLQAYVEEGWIWWYKHWVQIDIGGSAVKIQYSK